MNRCCNKSNQTICPHRLTCSSQNEEDDGQDVEGVMIGDAHLLVLPQGRMETWSLTASAASRCHLYLQLLFMTATVCQHTCSRRGQVLWLCQDICTVRSVTAHVFLQSKIVQIYCWRFTFLHSVFCQAKPKNCQNSKPECLKKWCKNRNY